MEETKQEQINPLLGVFNNPYGVPPFDSIRPEHFMPVFQQGMAEQMAIVKQIIESKEEPDFFNVIEKLEKSDTLLTRTSRIFYNLSSSNTNDEIQAIARDIAPIFSKHSDDISLNMELFAKVKNVYNKKDSLNLTEEQTRLLTETYKSFERSGANLGQAAQDSLREINSKLSVLTTKFSENVLKETNAFQMFIDNEADLAGLPESVKQSAGEAAKSAGQEGKWLFTLHKPSFLPFLQYAENRTLREKIYKAYLNIANNDNDNDNKKVISEIINLRVQKAKIFGYEHFSDYNLEDNMAKNAENVTKLLDQILPYAIKLAKTEVADMQKLIDKSGNKFKLEPWDWWYYSAQIKKEKFDVDEEMLRPYFQLEKVRDGVFMVANKLYGITITERNDIKGYHPDVRAFEVKEADGKHIGIFFADFFPRESKKSGAWSSSYRSQEIRDGKFITPIVVNVCNFSKPTADKPALLNLDEVTTLFHEFGHALHSLLSNSSYTSIGGTSVSRDFVELPSQVMENWATDAEVLKMYAKHYQTGETIPDELIAKMQKSETFNQGFATLEYLAASYLDIAYHTLKEPLSTDISEFEKQAMTKIGLIPEVAPRYRSTYFSHVFSGGYSSQYYSYIWAENLDADAFNAFKESGEIFNQNLAKSFRENILSKGNLREPMVLYKQFRGSEPKIEALLKRRGLI